MNKQLYLFGLLWMINLVGFSQSSIKQLQQTARDYNNRGDHANAVIVLRQGLRDFPKALELEKDLVLSFGQMFYHHINHHKDYVVATQTHNILRISF